MVKNICFVLSTFLIIYSPVYHGLDGIFAFSLLMTILGLWKWGKKDLSFMLRPLPILLFVFLYLLLNSVFNVSDVSYGDIFRIIFKPIRIIITALGCFFWVKLVYEDYKEKALERIFFFLFYAISLHSLIMVYEIYNTNFKLFLQGLFFSDITIRSSRDDILRMGGLVAVNGGAIVSIVQSAGGLLYPYCLKISNSRIEKIVLSVLFLIIVYSIMSAGRSGFYSILIFFPYALYSLYKGRGLRLFFYFGLALLAAFISINYFIAFANNNSGDINSGDIATLSAGMLTRTLDSFIHFKETGEVHDSTIDILSTMLLLPDDWKTMIFGNVEHFLRTGFGRSLNSDIGYIRDFWSMGIFIFPVYFYPYYYMFRKMRYSFKSNRFASVAIIFIFMTILFHAKEMLLYCRCLFSIIMITYFNILYYGRINGHKSPIETK